MTSELDASFKAVHAAYRQRIATLEANHAALLEALEPFAKEAVYWHVGIGDHQHINEQASLIVGDLRKARAVVQQVKGGEG